MRLVSLTRNLSLLAAITVLPVSLAASNHKNHALEKEGLELVREVEEIARDVRYHSGRLDAFLRFPKQVTRWTHAHHLNTIRELVNSRLNPALSRLEAIQNELPSWKSDAVTRMIQAASALASDADNAILTKAEAGEMAAANPEYRKFISGMYQHAEALVKTSDAAGAYGSARMKASAAGLATAAAK